MSATTTLIETWREVGPIEWAESRYGWIGDNEKPITLEPWQRAVLEAWWVHRSEVRTLGISCIKKVGKTFLDAVLLCWRWLAIPSRHFAVGNDFDQSVSGQFTMIADMVKRHPYLSRNVKSTTSRLVFEPSASIVEALAADAAGNAGANHATASHTEAWGIVYEGGIRAFEELTPPPGLTHGFPALRIVDSYAGFEGESNTWHSILGRGLQGKRVSQKWPIYKTSGLLLFHMSGPEARERCYRKSSIPMEQFYADEAASLRVNQFRRMHDNERSSGEDAFLPPGAWDSCYDPNLRPWQPGDRRPLVLGVDASTTNDSTALVATTYNYETKTVDVAHVRVWHPIRGELRGGKPTVDLEMTIGVEVERLRQSGVVRAICFDPYQLHTLAVAWERAGIQLLEMPQTSKRTEADQDFYTAVIGKSVRHYGDPTLAEHVKNAVAIETPRGFRLAKEKTSLKIDAAVAASMSHHAALEVSKAADPAGWIQSVHAANEPAAAPATQTAGDLFRRDPAKFLGVPPMGAPLRAPPPARRWNP